MATSFRLQVNQRACNKIERAKARAMWLALKALHTDVVQSQVMPFDTGTMQNNTTHDVKSQDGQTVSLVTDAPYAARLYYHPEYNFQHVNNRNAKGKWLEDYLTGPKKDFVQEKFVEFFRQVMRI